MHRARPLLRRGGLAAALFLCAALTPRTASPQVQEPPSIQRMRDLLEVQFLGGVTGSEEFSPSFRVTAQRRQTLGRSLFLSGHLLQDHLSTAAGLAVGSSWALPLGPVLLEPFGEVGATLLDGRVETGSYEILLPGGGVGTVDLYAPVEGIGGVAGGGVSLSGLLGEKAPLRLTLGYWHLVGGDGFSRGGVRVGASLGVGRRDARWYSLATDRTSPMARVVGRHLVARDSVEVEGPGVRVLAADASGIQRITVNGQPLELERNGGAASELGPGSVAAQAEVVPPFEGQDLDIMVQDSAGLRTRTLVRAYPAPDRDAPALEVLTPAGEGAPGRWLLTALAEDFSGIAHASVGSCQVGLNAVEPGADGVRPAATSRLVGGWGDFPGTATLVVVDRSGNESRATFQPRWPEIRPGAAAPVIQAEAVRSAAGPAVRIRGSGSDPEGGWIRRVTVDGRSVPLAVADRPTTATFDAWVTLPSGAALTTVTVTTMDGRTAEVEVPVDGAEAVATGQLHVVVVAPEGADDATLRTLAELAPESNRTLLLGRAAARERVVQALVALQRSVEPGDAVLVHLAGRLTGEVNVDGPSLALPVGSLQVSYLTRLLRSIPGAVTAVTTDLEFGQGWRAPLASPLGAVPSGGCVEVGDLPAGAVLALGEVDPATLVTALQGDADRNADGQVSASELQSTLGEGSPGEVTGYDPAGVVVVLGGGR